MSVWSDHCVRSKFKRSIFALSSLVALGIPACSEKKQNENAQTPVATPAPQNPQTPSTNRPNKPKSHVPHQTCARPSGAPATLASIKDLMDLINALPKPVELPCILDTLPRPLGVNATNSTRSVQPAQGPMYPRIFAISDKLVIGFLPGGVNSDLLEISELVSNTESIKAEISLPVAESLTLNNVFGRIYRADQSPGTTCAGCHRNERQAPKYGGTAYMSQALQPRDNTYLPFTELQQIKRDCDKTINARCDIMRALFGANDADTFDKHFPSDMPVF